MELKELFKIAGVDTTKGKAKKLCEASINGGLWVWTNEGEGVVNITDLSATTPQTQLDSMIHKYLSSVERDALSTEMSSEGEIVSDQYDPSDYDQVGSMLLAQYVKYIKQKLHNTIQF